MQNTPITLPATEPAPPSPAITTTGDAAPLPGSAPRARPSRIGLLLRAIRAHQWAKNVLLFVPVLTAHRVLDLDALTHAAGAFLSFSLCASSVYVLNDLLDLDADRRHPAKRSRPLASGDLSIRAGIAVGAICLVAGFSLSMLLPPWFQAVLALYYALTIAYSTYLKRKPLVDVYLLASLYTIRVLAGNAATGIAVSSWLLAFSMFAFLSAALLKRFTEVRELARRDLAPAGRGYLPGDAGALYGLGTASAFLSAAILALYINSQQVLVLYRTPMLLWLLCPLLLYWMSRVWMLASRGRVHFDPVLFALKDRVSYAVALCAGLVLLLATMSFGV